AEFAGASLGQTIVGRPHQEPAPRSFLRRIRQRLGVVDDAASANQRAATFVRIRLLAVTANRRVHTGTEPRRVLRHSSTVQNVSDRYFSAPSGNTVTTTP